MKKFLSLVLVFAMLCSLIVINISAADEVSVWDGSASTFLKGSGTKDDPYLIQSAADLKYFADTTNTGEQGAKYAGEYIVQTVDIDLNNITWTPISWKAENSFCGVYDGQGHTISNMKIDQNLAKGPCLALFGYIGHGHGSITLSADCGVANLNVTGSITATQVRVAGLVGQINSDAHVDNNHKVYITNVTTDVDITLSNYATNSIWGGVAGYVANAVFENVTNNGDFTATNCQVYIPLGGIAGRAEHVDMIGCVNNGNINVSTNKTDNTLRVGGIVGQIYKKNANQVQNFVNCVNNGAVSATLTAASQSVFVGGIVGGVHFTAPTSTWAGTTTAWRDYKTTFAGCVNTGAITGSRLNSNSNTNVGGIFASCYPGGGAGQNHGGFKFINCVNSGVVSALNETAPNRAAGITSSMYTDGAADYGIVMKGCVTGADATGDGEKLYGNYKILTTAANTNAANTANNATTATTYVNTYSAVVPSTIDINGFPTGVDTSVWTGGASAFFFGSGTATDPYLIRNANDLKGLANMVNGNLTGYNINGVDTFDGKYFKQTADIDLNNREWLPIGYREAAVFQGVYDGDNHSVINLKITAVSYRTGLFGGVGYVQSHKNLNTDTTDNHDISVPTADCGIANLNVSGNITLTGSHGDRFYYGGVVSFLGDEKLNCNYKAYLINVTSTVNVTTSGFGSNIAVGGVVGHAHNAVLENVVNKGTVSVTAGHCKQHTAGIVGMANSVTFKNCANIGNVTATTDKNNDHLRVGGLVGSYVKGNINDYMSFTNCYNTGTVTVTSSNASPNITLAGGILGGLWYNVGGDNKYAADTWTDGTTMWSDFKLEFINCTNTGAVSAYTTGKAASKASAGGILSTGYAGAGRTYNNGGMLFDNCVNVGTVNCTDADRASGIVGNLYTSGTAAFDTELIHCLTGKAADYADINLGHKAPTFYGIGADVKNQILHTASDSTNDPYSCSFGSSRAGQLAAWNMALAAPSTTNINNMPTAAKVAVLTGVKNDVVALPYAVPATMVVVDANGDKVTNITTAGEYAVKVALVGITPYVTDMFALDYAIAYEKDYLSDAAEFGFGFGELTNWSSATAFAEDFHKFSTYGKLTAAVSTGTFNSILPQQVGETVSMAVIDGEATLFTKDYSLATYATNMLAKTADDLGMSVEKKDAFDVFLVDMLKYAAAAQTLKKDTDNLVTNVLTDDQLALGSTFSAYELTNVKGVSNPVADPVIKWTAATLAFDSAVAIRLKFTTESLDAIAGYTFQVYTNGDISEELSVADYAQERDGYCFVEIGGFAPTTYADTVSVVLVDAEGNAVSSTISYSVNSYLVNKYEDAIYGELVKALGCYSASANKYLSIAE